MAFTITTPCARRYNPLRPQAMARLEQLRTTQGGALPPRLNSEIKRELPAVNPSELETIRIADRFYVAAEMTAFLIAFLSALPVRVLNRPCPGSISGPPWRPEQWIRAAALAGIPVMPARRSLRLASSNPPQTEAAAEVTVVGDHVIGSVDARLADWSCKLAREAGVGMLAAGFARHGGSYVLSGVNPSPELNTREKRDAARDYLTGGLVGVRV
jgi:hypothetical protein